MGRWRPC